MKTHLLLLISTLATAFCIPLIKFKSDNPLRFEDFAVSIEIDIGTKAQRFAFYVDTTSADSWVADQSCSYYSNCSQTCSDDCKISGCPEYCCHVQGYCPVDTLFVSSASKTYHLNGTNWFYKDGLSGFLGRDVVRISDSGIEIEDATFAQVNSLDNDGKPCRYCSGLSGGLGVALRNSSKTGTPSIFEQALELGIVDGPQIGIWMMETRNSDSYDIVGEITFGGYDAQKCSGQLSIPLPLIGADWRFSLSGAIVGKYTLDEDWTALIRPNQYPLIVTASLFENIKLTTNAYWSSQDEEYVVDCNQNVQLTFKTHGTDVVLEFQDYIFRDHNVCYLDVFFDTNQQNTVILGAVWLRAYCAILNVNTQEITYTRVT